ncbi:endonuclease VII domain-containing protein [Micromonospora aurantiaca (nom. illeg.)]|uniref:endonuclease VII domain-containing protein n=1 Tax=Micromonospora aurantiaca (nom. illeg.) TaxID=47850 RepID=UPI00378D137E
MSKRCSICKETRPLADFHRRSAAKDGLAPQCKECTSQNNKDRYLNRRGRKGPGFNDKDYYLRKYYGITEVDFKELLASQNNCCPICGSGNPIGKGWAVDHDHSCCPGKQSCGKCVRAVLCTECNLGLGKFRDSPVYLRKAADYLEKHGR